MTIAVYGASGYTGGLVLAELARRDVDLVLVGRDAGRLRVAADLVGAAAHEVRVAGLADPATLAAAFKDCDSVINCVAPFSLWGEPVVRASIAAGSHYVDVSGEQLYLERVFDTHAGNAERAEVSVVPMVNDGGFLADLIAHLVWASLGRVDEVRLVHANSGGGGLSRGSGWTALANRELFARGGLAFENGSWSTQATVEQTVVTFPESSEPSRLETCAMPEIVTIPRHVDARRVVSYVSPEVRAFLAEVTPDLVEGLPETGPDEEARRSGRFTLLADAVRGNDIEGRGVVQGFDTYGTTAVVAVEAAVRLAAGETRPGVLAPAQAFDPARFLDTLAPYGVTWSVTLESPA